MTSFFIYAFLISLSVTILVIHLTSKYNLFIDHSDTGKPQNFHTDATPRAGGIGILIGSMLLLFSSLGLKFIIPIFFAFASGIFEDLHNSLSPKLRLFLQMIAAVMAIWLTGAIITYLGLAITMPYWLGVIFSIFAIVGMMNAINIIDGFNGLASGVVVLILISFLIIGYTHHDSDILMVLSIILASILGFMMLNFPKGKIFLGDGGAYMLGFIVGVIGILLTSRHEDVSPWYILSIFIYPVWEVLFSIIRKLSIGLSPMQPDNKHMHMLIHRQITKNNPLTSVFILITILPNMLLSTYYAHNSIINIGIVITFMIGYLSLYRYLSHQEDFKNPS